jgi:hypothetical protein
MSELSIKKNPLFKGTFLYILNLNLLGIHAHVPGSSHNDSHGSVHISSVEVRHFLLSDLLDLGHREFSDLRSVRSARAFLFADSFQDESSGRLDLIGHLVSAVLVDLNYSRDGLASALFGFLVKALDEITDRNAGRTKHRAELLAWDCCSSWDLELQDFSYFLSHKLERYNTLNFLNLQEIELDRSLAAEHIDEHFDLAALLVYARDFAF